MYVKFLVLLTITRFKIILIFLQLFIRLNLRFFIHFLPNLSNLLDWLQKVIGNLITWCNLVLYCIWNKLHLAIFNNLKTVTTWLNAFWLEIFLIIRTNYQPNKGCIVFLKFRLKLIVIFYINIWRMHHKCRMTVVPSQDLLFLLLCELHCLYLCHWIHFDLCSRIFSIFKLDWGYWYSSSDKENSSFLYLLS